MDSATNDKIEKTAVEIEDIVKSEPDEFKVDGLLPQEVKMAEKHGLVKKFEEKPKQTDLVKEPDGEHKELPKSEAKENSEEVKEEKLEVKSTFEDVEKDEGKIKQYNPNEQALYWKWKSDKRKRQDAVKEKEDLKAQLELNQVKELSYAGKLAKIKQALKGDSLTVEMIQEILGDEKAETEAPITKSELARIESEKETKAKEKERLGKERAERIETAEKIGKTRYQNFEELTKLAEEVVSSDKTGTYRDVLQAAFLDTEIDENDLIERVVTIAKLNPNYGKKSEPKESDTKDVDRAITNSKKKISSATVGSGGNIRTISHDDLTVDDAAKLTSEQWRKLPDSVRKKLLMQ